MHGSYNAKFVLTGGNGDDVFFAKGESEETADELYGGLGNDEFRLVIDSYNLIGYHMDGGKDVDTLRMPANTQFGYDIDLGQDDMLGGVGHLYRVATLSSIENVIATDHWERIDGTASRTRSGLAEDTTMFSAGTAMTRFTARTATTTFMATPVTTRCMAARQR